MVPERELFSRCLKQTSQINAQFKINDSISVWPPHEGKQSERLAKMVSFFCFPSTPKLLFLFFLLQILKISQVSQSWRNVSSEGVGIQVPKTNVTKEYTIQINNSIKYKKHIWKKPKWISCKIVYFCFTSMPKLL